LSCYGILHEFFMSLQEAKTVHDLYTADMEENQNIERVTE